MKCVLWPGRDTGGVHDRFGELAGFPIIALSPFELRISVDARGGERTDSNKLNQVFLNYFYTCKYIYVYIL